MAKRERERTIQRKREIEKLPAYLQGLYIIRQRAKCYNKTRHLNTLLRQAPVRPLGADSSPS